MSNFQALAWFCFPLALVALGLLWPLWLLLGIGWGIARCFRPAGVKATERNRAKALANLQRQRVHTLIQMQLAAQGLPDTARNRALVAMRLGGHR